MMAQYFFLPHLEAIWKGLHTSLADPTAIKGQETDCGLIILETNLAKEQQGTQ